MHSQRGDVQVKGIVQIFFQHNLLSAVRLWFEFITINKNFNKFSFTENRTDNFLLFFFPTGNTYVM